MFTKILSGNCGEIAIRVMHACREMSIAAILLMFISACESVPAPTTTALPPPTIPAPTETYRPLPTPTGTATATPTRAPVPPAVTVVPPSPTPLPTLTSTPVATVVPPVRPAAIDHLPAITHDLLFIGAETLQRWDHVTNRIETLAVSVNSFSVDADGRRLELRRSLSEDEEEIAWLDLRTRQLTPLARVPSTQSESYYPAKLSAISPDGQWVAYLARGSRPSIDGTPLPTAVPIRMKRYDSTAVNGMIYAVRLDSPEQRLEVGYAATERTLFEAWGYGGLLWSPDSRAVMWTDYRGVWLAEPGKTGRMVIPHNTGLGFGFHVWHPLSWSPSGRYIDAVVGHYEGAQLGVLDTHTGSGVEVPDTHIYHSFASASWLQDDRLFVVTDNQYHDPATIDPPTVDVWRMAATPHLTLTREIHFRVSQATENRTVAPAQLINGQLVFALSNESLTNYRERGLYSVNLKLRRARKFTGIPPPPLSQYHAPPQIFWSPDGAGAIILNLSATDRVLDANGSWRIFTHTLYAATDGSPLYDLEPVVGDDVCCFTWLPDETDHP